MHLQDFIAETLAEIIGGIRGAGERCGAETIPPLFLSDPAKLGFVRVLHGKESLDVQSVEFDVAVTLTRDAGGKLTLGVAALGIGADAGTTARSEQISRVRFRIPLALPKD